MSVGNSLVLSTIIPTTGSRPLLLRRAIESARGGSPQASEVLVVVNGISDVGDATFGDDVRLLHYPDHNGNAARNLGLHEAKGEYVRFLDDDDVIDTEGSRGLLALAQANEADLATGGVKFLDPQGRESGRYVPRAEDLVSEILQQRHSTLNLAHLYRRSFLGRLTWDPSRRYLQDVDWMHAILRRGEARWVSTPRVVGAWCQHGGERVSLIEQRDSPDHALRDATRIILETVNDLESRLRLGGGRRAAAAKAIWDYAHQGFQYSPLYWTRVARRALELDSSSRPASTLMRRWPLSAMPPLLAEWAVFPLRSVARRGGR